MTEQFTYLGPKKGRGTHYANEPLNVNEPYHVSIMSLMMTSAETIGVSHISALVDDTKRQVDI